MNIRNVGNAEHYLWGDGCDGWRLLSRPDLSVIQERIPPGRGEVLHFHSRARQVFFVLSGRLDIKLGDTSTRLEAGDSIEVQPGIHHSVRNPAEADAHFLVISAPSTAGDRENVNPAPAGGT